MYDSLIHSLLHCTAPNSASIEARPKTRHLYNILKSNITFTDELKATFAVDKPKVVFCQSNKVADVKKALKLAELEAKIISYDSNPDSDVLTFSDMMEKYGEDIDVKDYR